ncbi:MAG: hypothetical protein QOF61_830 [Acidobacteriota bacterium]|nr:hypothetical protein [Acidobacteriota bacterium]
MKLFETDGGLQLLLPTRYVLKSSNMVKVDVEFDVPEDAKGRLVPEDEPIVQADESGRKSSPKENYQVVPNQKLKIKSISKPYLEPFDLD